MSEPSKPLSVKKRDLKEEEKKKEEETPAQSLATNLEQEFSVIPPEETFEVDEDFRGKFLRLYIPKSNSTLTYQFDKRKWSKVELDLFNMHTKSASVSRKLPSQEVYTLITGGDNS